MPLRDVTHSGRKKILSRNKHEKNTQLGNQLWRLVLTFTKEFHLHYWKSKFTMVTASSYITFIPNKGICRGWSELY